MKKVYKLPRHIRHRKTQAFKQQARRLKSNRKRKKIRRRSQGKNRQIKEWEKARRNYVRIAAPKNFSFLLQPEKTIEFINKLEWQYERKNKVFVELENIEELDYSAISVLVSVMFTFKSKRIKIDGSYPKKYALRAKLDDSDFFKYLRKPIGDKIDYTIGKQNQIFTKAHKEVTSELGGVVMEEASMTIWGERRVCKGLQRTLLELMHNTNNHAHESEKGVKHWWLSVNHDKSNKKVSFAFIDYGIGIFESLKNKPSNNKWYGVIDKIKHRLLNGTNDEVLESLLNGKLHMTATGKSYRGKGLPGIKQVQNRNQISNLHIISNNVYADVQNETYKLLPLSFSGTFAYWELNQHNVNSEWNIKM